jgi:glutathione S-transferase
MKLYYATPSPFARKVRVLIAEKQLSDIEAIKVNPFDRSPELLNANPLSKVPALAVHDGTMLYDSPVICEYLDQLGNRPRFLPNGGARRWTVLRRQALADGLMDTTLLLALETNRRVRQIG